MKDGVIAGTGDSRYLKSVSNFLTLYPNYEAFVTALVEGTLPIDLNGINEDGWTQVGMPLNKATLLDDATTAALEESLGFEFAGDPTPNEALYRIATAPGQVYDKILSIITESALSQIDIELPSLTGYNKLILVGQNIMASSGNNIYIRLNDDSTSAHYKQGAVGSTATDSDYLALIGYYTGGEVAFEMTLDIGNNVIYGISHSVFGAGLAGTHHYSANQAYINRANLSEINISISTTILSGAKFTLYGVSA